MAEGTLSQMEAVGNAGRTTKKIIDYYPVNHCAVYRYCKIYWEVLLVGYSADFSNGDNFATLMM